MEQLGPGGGAGGGAEPPAGPEGQELLKPNKGFVIKTWQRTPGKKDFDREMGKLFINVCSHDDIEKPSCQDVTGPDGRKGQSWSMPHLVSPQVGGPTGAAPASSIGT